VIAGIAVIARDRKNKTLNHKGDEGTQRRSGKPEIYSSIPQLLKRPAPSRNGPTSNTENALAQIAFAMDHGGDDELFYFNFVNDAIAVGEQLSERWILKFGNFTA
jgi:hypothetical protein